MANTSDTDCEKVKFHLPKGYRIGHYRIDKRLGSGCTAEAYLATEVPTWAPRVIKIYDRFEDRQRIQNLKDFAHYCWFMEEFSHEALLPRYHHMGHFFLDDEIGHYFIVQEFLGKTKFSLSVCTDEMIDKLFEKVRSIHEKEYALGDWHTGNLVIHNNEIRMIDCDYGSHDKPNSNFSRDKRELKRLFSRTL